MANRPKTRGATGLRVAANIRRRINADRLSYQQVSDRLADAGRVIPADGVRRLADGARAIDVDELADLADALRCDLLDLLSDPDGDTPDLATQVADLAARVDAIEQAFGALTQLQPRRKPVAR